MNKLILLIFVGLSLQANDFYYERGEKVTVTKIQNSRANDNITYYQNSLGKKIGVTNEIIFQCNDTAECLRAVEKYDLSDLSKLSDSLYIVKIKEGTNIFTVAQQLHEEESIEFANPNFIKERRRR
jgi:hypothetical protein